MKRAIVAAASALLIAALSSPAQANLVTNGGFETGNLSGWTLTGDTDFNFVDAGFAHGGSYAMWFGEVNGLASLSQTLATTAGATYTLSFWFAGDDTPSEFQALVDSKVLIDLVNPPFVGNYVPYSFTFTASSASTLLTFKGRDDAVYINLDDVDVSAAATVPEPESLVLVLAGLLGLTASRAARRKARRAA